MKPSLFTQIAGVFTYSRSTSGARRLARITLALVWVIAAAVLVPACDKDKQAESGVTQEALSAAPRQFQSQVVGDTVTLSWEPLPGAKYNVYMASEPGVTPLTVDRLKNGKAHQGVNSPFDIAGLQEGVTYYFVVTAFSKLGESDPSLEISATPLTAAPVEQTTGLSEPPKNLQAQAGDGQITLSWDPVPGATQYNLYMATEYGINPKLYSQLHNGMAHLNVTSPYTIYGLKNHEIHYFVIAAVDARGEGPISAELFATPSPPQRPPTPRNFSAQSGNGQITLYWDAHSEVHRYNIYAATQRGVSATTYSRLPGSMTVRNITSPYVFRGLSNGLAYYFVLTGETDTGGESEATEEISAVPHLPELPSPADVQVLAGDRKLTVRWQAARGADRYNIYMAQQPGVSPATVANMHEAAVFQNASSPLEIADLQNETTYYITVTAANSAQESKPSGELSATPRTAYIPPAPRSQNSITAFITLDAKGRPLADQSTPYATQPWRCVRSRKMGLIWEVKSAEPGLQYNKNTYTWHHPDANVNGGNPGVVNGGKCAGSACDVYAYVQEVNKNKLCGFTDWRLPTRDELLSLVDTKAAYPRPTIDIDAFPNTVNSYYWTGTVYDFDRSMAWFVYFGSGYEYYEYKTFASHVRLVRGKITE